MFSFKDNIKSDQGFTIFEVLIALFIITMVFVGIPLSSVNDRAVLENAIDDIDRAIRFTGNEAVLRNAITRLVIDMSKNPPEYFAEFGSEHELLLPQLDDPRTLKDDEENSKKTKSIDSKFNKIPEFEEMKREIDGNVSILGVYTGTSSKFVQEGKGMIYFYPSGERDSALIVFATLEEVASLDVMPFQNKTEVVYEPIFAAEDKDIEEQQKKIREDMYSSWAKK